MFLKFNFLLILLVSKAVFAQSENATIPNSYIAFHTSEALEIDGDDTEVAWEKVPWSSPLSIFKVLKSQNITHR